MICPHCTQAPCVWTQYRKETLESVHENVPDDSPNNVKRRIAYQSFVRARFGILGRNNRVENPTCVLAGVRKEFPPEEESGHYMGHRPF